MSYLENNILKLRALEPEDLGLLYQWENNSEWWHVGNTINPYSKFVLRQYLVDSDKSIYENKQLRLMVELKESKQTIGMIDLYEYDPQNNRAGVGVIIDEKFQQKGYASGALSLLIEYGFGCIGLRSLYAHILPENTASVELFKKQGFQKTGTLKNWIRRKDEYLDIDVYQLIKDLSTN